MTSFIGNIVVRNGQGGREQIRAQAAAMIPDVLQEREAKLIELNEKHETDKHSYGFRCERFGDFLSLFISRGKEKYAGSLNLGVTQAISQNLGFEPDMKGEVTFRRGYGGRDYSQMVAEVVWDEYRPRALVHIEPPQLNDRSDHGYVMMSHSSDDYLHGLRVADCPRAAQDDKIKFEGPRATIFAPAGLGHNVYEKILQAIAAGER